MAEERTRTPRRDVVLLCGLGLLLILPWLLALGLLWNANHLRQLKPLVKDGFRLSAWHMPTGLYYPNIMEYCDGPGIGIVCMDASGGSYSGTYNRWLDLDATPDGGLKQVRSLDLNGRWAMMAEHNGRILSAPQLYGSTSTQPLHVTLDWLLGSALDGRQSRGFNFTLQPGVSLCLVTLRDDRLALIDVTPETDGSLRLRIQPPGGMPEVVQRIQHGVTSGPAFVHGRATQFIFDQQGDVWVFDHDSERFAQAPELKALGAKLAAHKGHKLGYTALCDSFAAVFVDDSRGAKVQVFSAADGFQFKTVDPTAQPSSGWPRGLGGWPFYRGYSSSGYGPDFSAREGRRLATRGRRVPLDTLADSYSDYYLRFVPYDTDCLAIADCLYQRLILIEPE